MGNIKMSKERELLESCLEEMQYHSLVCPELKFEIKELIAQPEQTEQEDIRDVWQDGYEAGLRLAKQESLTDEELEVWYSQHTWAMEKQEYMWGFRDAEKAYGIGVA